MKARRRLGPATQPNAAPPTNPRSSFTIVGVGASAGGLEAFTQLLNDLPTDTGMSFVLVQHLDPVHESALAQILSRATRMPVQEVEDPTAAQPNHVYVIPRDKTLTIGGGALQLHARSSTRAPHRPIDAFFESLAQDQQHQAIGVVLSGTATDGTAGLEAIKAEGGLTFAQDDSAKHDSMPRSAVAAGVVDFVLSPRDIALELARIAKHPSVATPAAVTLPARSLAKTEADGYTQILLLLRQHAGVDFSLYRSTTIQRRITRRMVVNRQDTLEDYARLLRGNAQELDALYADVLISVTSFFRNPEAFDALKREVLPALLAQRGDDPVRVWVLGCSTGQEAFSIAIAFVEVAEQAPRARRLQVFATDLNDKLLEKARHGWYAKNLVADVSPERLRRFFVEEDGGYRVTKRLREMVVFARQNLTSDPPFSRMDLISCRNLLIYLEPALQQKALPTFHYALKPKGYLLLGASESIGGFTDLFAPVDKKHKVFVKKPAPTPALHLPLGRDRAEGGPRVRLAPAERAEALGGEGLRHELSAQREADRIAITEFAPPGVLINDELQVLQFRGSTGAFLEPPAGKATFDVLKMAREGLMLPLRHAINEARKTSAPTRVEKVRVTRNGDPHTISVRVIPLKNVRERCYLVLFEDADAPPRAAARTPAREPRQAPPVPKEAAAARVAELETELAETREYLQSVQEQADATNEELQASNEEIQSANEELQSVNEELETSKEELESTNEELTTLNEEMNNRNVELQRLNNDLVNLQTSTALAIILLDHDLTVRRFSPQAEQQFNLLAGDVGRPIGHVRHHLLVTSEGGESPLDLESLAAEVISSVRAQDHEVHDRSGRRHSLRVRPYLTLDNRVDGAVLVLVDITDLKRTQQAVTEARDFADNIVATVREALLVLDGELRVERASRAFYDTFRVRPEETERRLVYELGNREWDIPHLRRLLEEILPRRTTVENFKVEQVFENIGRRVMLVNARRLHDPQRGAARILLAIEDITERQQGEDAVAAGRAKDEFLAVLSHELRTPLTALLLQADLLRRASSDPSALRALDTIERAARSQARLIDDLLDASRIAAGKLEMDRRPLPIVSVVREAIDLVRQVVEQASIALNASLDDDPGTVLGDPARLRQVVWNLLMNAIKFTPKGGRVTVTAERVDAHARIQVADTGEGIAPEVLPRIFEIFFQADRARSARGLGVGLALVQKIVEQHGGAVTAESAGPGRGSTFTVTLPLIEDSRAVGAATERALGTSGRGARALAGVRILVVEDDTATREALHEILEQAGALVQAAASTADAMGLFERFRPQLVACDIAMPPGDDGYDLMRRLRDLGPARGGDVPAIALTALAGPDDRRRALEAGFQMHVAKPVDADDLIDALVRLHRRPEA